MAPRATPSLCTAWPGPPPQGHPERPCPPSPTAAGPGAGVPREATVWLSLASLLLSSPLPLQRTHVHADSSRQSLRTGYGGPRSAVEAWPSPSSGGSGASSPQRFPKTRGCWLCPVPALPGQVQLLAWRGQAWGPRTSPVLATRQPLAARAVWEQWGRVPVGMVGTQQEWKDHLLRVGNPMGIAEYRSPEQVTTR